VDAAAPSLRRDLLCRRQESAEGATWVVKDPASGEYYRMREVEGFVAAQMDGSCTLDRIQDRASTEFGIPLPQNTLNAFVAQLDRGGLLENERGERTRARARRGHFGGNLLHARMKLLDPERLLAALEPRLRFAFTPRFFALSAAIMLAAVAIAAFNWNELGRGLSGLVQLSTLPMLVLTIFVTISLHEFAHGLTCKHFGGEVREMGFMLLYFQPAFYCNVSDAWLFPEKSKRLWVGFAGPWFELLLWALATVAWRVTDLDTAVNRVALVVMGVTGIKTLFNFNPLIKLDGYYLLSDWLEIPNLRRKAFAHVGGLLRRLAGGEAPAAPLPARERRVYLAYGVTAWLFSVSLLSWIGFMFGEYLIVEGQRVAFFALSGLLAFRFRDHFAKLFRRKDRDDAARSEPPPRKRDRRRIPWLKLAAAAAVVALLGFGRLELKVTGPIGVLPQHNADVRTEIEGIVEEIFVDEGQRLRAGDAVARLSDTMHRAELQKTDADIRRVRAKLAELVAGPTPSALEVARLAVATADDRLEFAAAKRARAEELFRQRLVSNQDFDLAREQETAAGNELAEARGRLAVLLAGTRPEQISAARAELAWLEEQQRFLSGQLARTVVHSPADGVVTTPSRHLRELLRRVVPKGGLIAKVHALDVITVEANVSEKEIADVRVGQQVVIKTRAHPDRVFRGRVIAIGTTTLGSTAAAPAADAGGAAPAGGDTATTVRVTTEIDNEDGLLKPGMTGMAKIYCGERSVAELIARRMSRTFRVEFWSWW
jgi:multidrug resistance efflux pump